MPITTELSQRIKKWVEDTSSHIHGTGDMANQLIEEGKYLWEQVAVQEGVGGREIGTLDYNDLATQTTPIAVTGNGSDHKITIDGEGAYTNKLYPPIGVTDVWDVDNDQFDFSQLSLGDHITIRVSVIVTTLSNFTDVHLAAFLGIGVSEYEVHLIRESYKSTGTYELSATAAIYMGNELTLDNPGEIRIHADANITVEVVGVACLIHKY
jgi:hypothetical protein